MSTVPDIEAQEGDLNLRRSTSSETQPIDRDAHTNETYDDSEEPKKLEEYTGPQDGEDVASRFEAEYAGSRVISRVLTEADQLIKEANDTDEPLPPMGGGKPYPPALADREPYCVGFDGPNDPTHPQNYSRKRKMINTFVVAFAALNVSIGSAIFSQAATPIMEEYHIGATTATLGTSLFVMGFASGPIIFGPLSELYGRKTMMVPSAFGYMLFTFAVATAKDIQTIMICRFFAGFVGSAPFVISPAIMADIFTAKSRGRGIDLFAMVLFTGPAIAPIIGAFTVKNPHLGWRWTEYLCGIIGAASLFVTCFFLDETHHPLVLVKKAENLRRRTGNWGIYAPQEEVSLNIMEIVEKTVTRPIHMLIVEPILLLVTIYNAFIYGMLYLFLIGIPYIFAHNYRFEEGIAELPYIALFIGLMLGALVVLFFESRYIKAMNANGGKPVPEVRLEPMMLGGSIFTIGLFWLGWTGQYADKIHWIVPTISIAFVGFGFILVFLPCITYIIDCYLFLAASALAGNTLIRSAFGAAFPMFARQMLEKLGVNWAITLVGCVSLILIPVPFMFYKYGKSFRERSQYAFVL